MPSTSKKNRCKKPLTEEQLLHYIMKDDDSVILELSDDDHDDANNIADLSDFIDNCENDIIENTLKDIMNGDIIEEVVENEKTEATEETEDLQAQDHSKLIKEKKAVLEKEQKEFFEICDFTEKEEIGWRNNVIFETHPVQLFAREDPPKYDLPPPIHFLFAQMPEMTNLYAVQRNIARFPPTTIEEVKKFIGIHIIMGNFKLPRARLY